MENINKEDIIFELGSKPSKSIGTKLSVYLLRFLMIIGGIIAFALWIGLIDATIDSIIQLYNDSVDIFYMILVTMIAISPFLVMHLLFIWLFVQLIKALFLEKYNKIVLTSKGMHIKNVVFLRFEYKFYPYGEFLCHISAESRRGLWLFRINHISKDKCRFFDKSSSAFVVVDNMEQDMEYCVEKLVIILRERSKIELDKQGKDYDLNNKIRILDPLDPDYL